MIGNDIVDLLLAKKESNWQRARYLDKLFSPAEQLMILETQTNPDFMVWLLWSMKEAAYKIISRRTGLHAFIPTKLLCEQISLREGTAQGKVRFSESLYFTKSTFSAEYVHTIAAESTAALEKTRAEISVFQQQYQRNILQSVSHHGRYLALAYS